MDVTTSLDVKNKRRSLWWKNSSQLESLGFFWGSYKPSVLPAKLRGCMCIHREWSKYLLIGHTLLQNSASNILVLRQKSQALTRIATNRPLPGRRATSASILGERASRITCSGTEKFERNQKLLECIDKNDVSGLYHPYSHTANATVLLIHLSGAAQTSAGKSLFATNLAHQTSLSLPDSIMIPGIYKRIMIIMFNLV